MMSLILRMRFIILFFIPITLLWLTSFRQVRLKIGDYYFNQGNFDQAVNWYEKVVRKEKLRVGHDESDRLKYEEDLTKFISALFPVLEERLFNVSKLLGFGEIKDLRSQLMDPKFFLKDVNHLVGNGPKERLLKAKEDLVNFINISSYYKNLLEKEPNSIKLEYLVSMGYFLQGIIGEAENNFISADTIYEKIAISYSEISNSINERRNRILPKVADEYFKRSRSIRRVANANVLLESESPLIITGVVPEFDNYLEYETCSVNLIMQKYSSTKLKIKGEVLGAVKKSCIIPRVVFWGPKGYAGKTAIKGYIAETALKYPVEGKFDINFLFTFPGGTASITPRITFDPSCFSKGQKILVKDLKLH